jgi:hypothetical protein
MKVVDAENPLDLSEKASQESEVPSGHPYEARYDLRDELLLRKRNAGWGPSPFEQFLNLSRIERAKLMDEPDARVELRKAGDALLDTRHADENHTGSTLVEDGSHLLEAVHLETIGLVHED